MRDNPLRGIIKGYNRSACEQRIKFKIGTGFILVLSLFYFLDESGVFACMLIASAVHELGHLAGIALAGSKATCIKLELTGAIITYDSSRVSYFGDAFIAAMGPFFGIILSLFSSVFAGYDESSLVLSGVSFCLNGLNLLPAHGLDGGVIIYALLSELKNETLADRVLCATTCLTVFVLLVLGCYILIITRTNFTFLLVGAWILFDFIRASYRPKG